MTEKLRLYLTIGPVQPFVEASRRTRDLWASSFLLSHLAANAIEAAEQAGAKIVLPYRERLGAQRRSDSEHGGVPNRFVAEGGDLERAAKAAETAFRDTWRRIAGAVYEKFVAGITGRGEHTDTIWNRQLDHFWDIGWVIAEFDALPLRKNWRTTPATVEPGDHCTVMGDWQELSGFVRSVQRRKQDEFWKEMRERVGELDLADDERLCAIALLKRLAPKVAEKWLGRKLDAINWPSTPYLAAVPWLRHAAEKNPEKAKEYADLVCSFGDGFQNERNARIRCLDALRSQATKVFLALDGNLFQENALRNEKVVPLDQDRRRRLGEKLEDLYKTVGARPSVFFALLLMDGDSMGTLLSTARDQDASEETKATEALSRFSIRADIVVREHNGVTVYAGGDDLLALLPVNKAIGCAIAVREAYIASFATTCSPEIASKASISSALIFAHYHYPLRNLLERAHFLLDEVAKDATGRDSVAISVCKMGGETCRWSAPWRHLKTERGNLLEEVIDGLSAEDGGDRDRREFTSSFFFNLRERFAQLAGEPIHEPGRFGQLAEGVELEELLLAEYLRGIARRTSEEPDQKHHESARASVAKLLSLCRQAARTNEGELRVDNHTFGIDGPLLIRFLASERMGDAV
ncbi:MAG: type III-B CRISPR-associated protein Cas10/Cmr2 [Thermoguttaceae bacterium]